jgi:hypothetical protein
VRFTRHRKRLRAHLDATERLVLSQLCRDLLSLVAGAELSDDPLAALVGLPPGDVSPPDDPILSRLLPDAYRDDPAAAGDFRRYTDADLRATKRADAKAVLAQLEALPDSEGVVELDIDRDQADRWLGALNDMRLALGTALGVTEDTDYFDLDEEDPATQALYLFSWLGELQESLVSCLEPRPQ